MVNLKMSRMVLLKSKGKTLYVHTVVCSKAQSQVKGVANSCCVVIGALWL